MKSSRLIYCVMFLTVAIPIVFSLGLPPARMPSAEKFFSVVDAMPSNQGAAFIAFDFGPGTSAENKPQSAVILEHLFRKRIPVILFSLVPISEPFLRSIPEKIAGELSRETGEVWEYGKDWINLGFRPGGGLFLQTLAKSDSIPTFLGKDIRGESLTNIPMMASIKTIKDISFLGQFTGLVGTFQNYVQYFQVEGYTPIFGHGCTSITIPEAYIYLDSGQLKGLLEGLAGAAWYSELLRQKFPARGADQALVSNTALGLSQLMILFFIALGNILPLLKRKKG